MFFFLLGYSGSYIVTQFSPKFHCWGANKLPVPGDHAVFRQGDHFDRLATVLFQSMSQINPHHSAILICVFCPTCPFT